MISSDRFPVHVRLDLTRADPADFVGCPGLRQSPPTLVGSGPVGPV